MEDKRLITVLAVEDDGIHVQLIRKVLENPPSSHPFRFKFKVLEAATLSSAFAVLSEKNVDVVLLDLGLPDSNGLSTFEAIQSKAIHVPVLIWSSLNDDSIAAEAVMRGAQDYLLKTGINPDSLIHSLVYALLRHRVQLAGSYRQLHETEMRLRKLVETNADGIMVVDLFGKIRFANPSVEAFFGRQAGEMNGTLFGHPLVANETIEVNMYRKNGAPIPVEMRVVDISWEGEPALLASIRDITKRKKVEEALRQEKDYIEHIVSAAPFIICGIQLDGTTHFVNPAVTRVTGYAPQEIVGKNWWKIFYPGPEHAQVERLFEDFKKGPVVNYQMTLTAKDGSKRTVSWNSVNRYDAEHKTIEIIGIGLDITDQLELEKQFLRTQRLESMGTLVSGIAHDLNNLLAPILMAVPLLKERIRDERSQQVLANVEVSAKRGAEMVNQILTFARGVQSKRIVFQASHLIREIVGLVNDTFPKSIEVELSLPKNLWKISGDPTQVHQILLNLCVNARDAMPNGGRLKVSAENVAIDESDIQMSPDAKLGPHVLIIVSDTGHGIPKEHLSKIFEPFFTTKDPEKGTGLGLSTVAAIVKNHSGFLVVRSEPGNGAEFRVFLPANLELQEQQEVKAKWPQGHGETVLLVEDEIAVRDITRISMESFGYRVVTAGHGEEALAAFARNPGIIKVVLLDMMMPLMDGATFLRALQRLAPEIKIILASGISKENFKAELSSRNVRAFLPKPYTAEKLLETLDQVLKAD